MKLLVISDTHGATENLCAAILRQSPGLVLHLGDHCADLDIARTRFPDVPMTAVRGNCDPFSNERDVRTPLIEGRRFYMTHGHLQNVKFGYLNALMAAREAGASVLLFGHTHKPLLEQSGDVLVLNPGSAGSAGCRRSYAVLTVAKDGLKAEIVDF